MKIEVKTANFSYLYSDGKTVIAGLASMHTGTFRDMADVVRRIMEEKVSNAKASLEIAKALPADVGNCIVSNGGGRVEVVNKKWKSLMKEASSKDELVHALQEDIDCNTTVTQAYLDELSDLEKKVEEIVAPFAEQIQKERAAAKNEEYF